MTDFVYIMKEKVGDLYKIGFTSDIELRTRALNSQVKGGVELLCTIPGARRLELRLHEICAESRHKGEWFNPSDIIFSLIDLFDVCPINEEFDGTDLEKLERYGVQKSIFALDLLVQQDKKNGGRNVQTALKNIANEHGIPHGVLWSLRYRPPKFIPSGVLLKLQEATKHLDPEEYRECA